MRLLISSFDATIRVKTISYPESSGFLVSGATPGRLWGHRKNSIFLIGCSETVSIVLPQKSCGNKIRCPQSLPGVAPLTKKPEDSGYEIGVKRAFHPAPASRGFASHVFLVYVYICVYVYIFEGVRQTCWRQFVVAMQHHRRHTQFVVTMQQNRFQPVKAATTGHSIKENRCVTKAHSHVYSLRAERRAERVIHRGVKNVYYW